MISDMKPMLIKRSSSEGFALPTIIIASVILLTVLVTSVSAVGSITAALASQYYNQLAREASESGLSHARACLRASNYAPTWTDAAPLKPNTDCNGVELGSVSKWIINSNNIRTSFTVPAPQTGAVGSVRVTATAVVELLRASDQNQVWRTYSYQGTESSRYNDVPQLAGGAGWKGNGHNGYMLATNGTLYGWGDNSGQQLGDVSLGTTIKIPMKITPPDGVTRIKKVYNSGQGASILCIIATHSTLGDQVYCRGMPGAAENGLMPHTPGWYRFGLAGSLTATDMALNGFGADSACVLASNQQMYCAGDNHAGMFGDGNDAGAVVPIGSPVQFNLAAAGATLKAVKVYVQDWFTCVIADDSRGYCAGANNLGQLGRGNTTANPQGIASTPAKVQIPGDLPLVDIRMTYHGFSNSLFFQTSPLGTSRMFMSGSGMFGTAVDGSFSNTYTTPREITVGASYSKIISVGEEGNPRHAVCVIAGDQTPPNSGVFCVGSDKFGQLGNTSACNVDQAWWQGQSNLGGEAAIWNSTSTVNYQMNSVMVITTAGNVWAWGDNTYGKLGRGGVPAACNSTPQKVQLPAGVKAVDLANGDEYTAFVLGDNGKVYAMGRNNNGQLGDGTTTDRTTPVEVKIPRQEIVY